MSWRDAKKDLCIGQAGGYNSKLIAWKKHQISLGEQKKMYEFRESDAWDFARQQGIEVKQNGNELHFKTCPYCRPKATKGNIRTFSIVI